MPNYVDTIIAGGYWDMDCLAWLCHLENIKYISANYKHIFRSKVDFFESSPYQGVESDPYQGVESDPYQGVESDPYQDFGFGQYQNQVGFKGIYTSSVDMSLLNKLCNEVQKEYTAKRPSYELISLSRRIFDAMSKGDSNIEDFKDPWEKGTMGRCSHYVGDNYVAKSICAMSSIANLKEGNVFAFLRKFYPLFFIVLLEIYAREGSAFTFSEKIFFECLKTVESICESSRVFDDYFGEVNHEEGSGLFHNLSYCFDKFKGRHSYICESGVSGFYKGAIQGFFDRYKKEGDRSLRIVFINNDPRFKNNTRYPSDIFDGYFPMENKKDDCVYPSDFASQIGLAGKVDDLVKMGFNIECKFINLGYIMDMKSRSSLYTKAGFFTLEKVLNSQPLFLDIMSEFKKSLEKYINESHSIFHNYHHVVSANLLLQDINA